MNSDDFNTQHPSENTIMVIFQVFICQIWIYSSNKKQKNDKSKVKILIFKKVHIFYNDKVVVKYIINRKAVSR
jgi:hypothetical protein